MAGEGQQPGALYPGLRRGLAGHGPGFRPAVPGGGAAVCHVSVPPLLRGAPHPHRSAGTDQRQRENHRLLGPLGGGVQLCRWADIGLVRGVHPGLRWVLRAGWLFHRSPVVERGDAPPAPVHGRICAGAACPSGAGVHGHVWTGDANLGAAALGGTGPGGAFPLLRGHTFGPVLRAGPSGDTGGQLPSLLPHQHGHPGRLFPRTPLPAQRH